MMIAKFAKKLYCSRCIKRALILAIAFCASMVYAQDGIYIPYSPTLTNELLPGIYVEIDGTKTIKSINIGIKKSEYSDATFEIQLLEAPKMKPYKMYELDEFKSINTSQLIAKGSKDGGEVSLLIPNGGVKVSDRFVVLLTPTKESVANAIVKIEKVVSLSKTDRKKEVSYYGPTISTTDNIPDGCSFIAKHPTYYSFVSNDRSIDITIEYF